LLLVATNYSFYCWLVIASHYFVLLLVIDW